MLAQKSTMAVWNRLSSIPGGRQLFSTMLSLRAPYFRTVLPTVREMEPGRCAVSAHRDDHDLGHAEEVIPERRKAPLVEGRLRRGYAGNADQNADSSSSMRELSAASTILRRERSSGSTFLAKNRAAPILPW